MKLILNPEDPVQTNEMGGKAAALAALHRAGLPIPAWFVLTPEAFLQSLTERQHTAWFAHPDEDARHRLMADVSLSAKVCQVLQAAVARLCPDGEPVAVRSSALDEDGEKASFAGQYESYLFVSSNDVAERVHAVWQSAFSKRVRQYRQAQGLPPGTLPPAVLIQRMVDADVSGVAFGVDPMSGRRSIAVVSAVYGLGSSLVSGAAHADTYYIDRTGTLRECLLAPKVLMHRPAPGGDGLQTLIVPAEKVHQPSLSEAQARAVAALVRRVGRLLNRPQDIEWAFEQEQLYLLQSRPITSLAGHPDPDGVTRLWDNTNLVESYGSTTTPLTYTFARRAYEAVYRQFARLLHMPEATLTSNAPKLAAMVGLLEGRMYYNLTNWYHLLALLPGYALNRAFLDQMLGIKERTRDDAPAERLPTTDRFRGALHVLRVLGTLIRCHFTLKRRIHAFYARLERALSAPDLHSLRVDELTDHYRHLEQDVLQRWDAPVVNDFFAMVFYGVLRQLASRWCGRSGLQNDLLCGTGGLISAEPARRVCAMAEDAAASPEATRLLTHGTLREIEEMLERNSILQEHYRDYLARFGDRCMDELKLESPTLHDNPLPLLRAVGQVADRIGSGQSRSNAHAPSPRDRAERDAAEALGDHPFRRWMFNRVLRHTRARVRDRENLRFERTRAFGTARRIFLEIGRRFYAENQLEAPRDVFYLELHEILGFVEGTATTTDLKGLVAVRKRNFARYADASSPGRFITRGSVHGHACFKPESEPAPAQPGAEGLQGVACCPGRVRGPVCVVTNPQNITLKGDEILVARQTDPGWIMLFPSCRGLLVERGSLLSHAAIVSRELGLPSVVSLTGVTTWLHDGDWVEMDGSTGVVRRIAPLPEPQTTTL